VITGDSAAASAGRIVIFDHCAAASAVIQYSDIHWTAKAATGLALERANVCAVTGRGIGDRRVVERARLAALISCGAGCHGRVDRGAARQERHRLSWTTVISQRNQHRIGSRLITGACEAGRIGGDAQKIMAAASDGAVNTVAGGRSTCGVARAVSSGLRGYD